MAGDECVETTPEIIAYFNRKGLGQAKYFIYKSLRVGPYDTDWDQIEKDENTPLGVKMHGDQVGRVVGRDT